MGKFLIILCAYLCTSLALAQAPIAVDVVENKAPIVAAPQAAPVAPVVAPAPPPVKSIDEIKLTVKDEAMVPPEWVQNAIISAKSLPVVGPFLVTAMQWLGMFASIMTALFAFLWAMLKALESVASIAKLAPLAEKLANFQNSKLMYYLKALSVFNAQKKDKPV